MSPNGNKVVLWSVFGGLVALVGFAAYKIKQNIDLLRSAKITLANLKLDTKKSDAWVLDLIFSVENKSSIEVEVVGYNIDVSLNGVHVMKTVTKTSQFIASNGKSEIVVPVAFNPKTILMTLIDPKMWTSLIKGNISGIGVDIKGVISVRNSGITINDIPVDYKVNLSDYIGGAAPTPSK